MCAVGMLFICIGLSVQAQSKGEIVNLSAFFHAGDKDATPAIRKAIAYCKKVKASKLVLPANTYECWPDEAQEKYIGGGKRVEDMSKSFEKIAKRYNCLFVNGYTAPGIDINTMTPDGLHLDAVASRKMIEPAVALMIK